MAGNGKRVDWDALKPRPMVHIDDEGAQLLAYAVLRQAYEDYITDCVTMMCLEEPFDGSQNLRQEYEQLYERMRKQCNKTKQAATPEKMTELLSRRYRDAEADYQSLCRFFEGKRTSALLSLYDGDRSVLVNVAEEKLDQFRHDQIALREMYIWNSNTVACDDAML